jgi:hypothetical protein
MSMATSVSCLVSAAALSVVLSVAVAAKVQAQSILSIDREAEMARIKRLEAQAQKMNPPLILSSQPAQVSGNAAKVAAGTKGKLDLFFVGFAGDGTQDVFLSEVQFARDTVAAKYGSASRSLLMVNNLQSVNKYPLATQANLAASLKAVARKMNGSEDVLMFFLTSHGLPNGTASTELPGFKNENLSAAQLRDALDKAGIKNRIIILSACFAGSFIPALRNDDTLILTAASAYKTSFGCANERQLTYFGDAFFQQALPQSASLTDAFNLASEKIAIWERRDRLDNSQPQILMGSNIGAMLEKLDAKEK